MKKRLLKIYGETNTGTNYLSKLVKLNLDVDQVPGVVPMQVATLQRSLTGRQLVRDFFFSLRSTGILGVNTHWFFHRLTSGNTTFTQATYHL